MSIRTAELKALVVNELGAGFEDFLESAKVDVSRWEGSKRAFDQGAEKVTDLLSHIKKDATEGVVENNQSEYAQKFVMRAAEVLKNLRLQAEAMELKTRGKVEGLQLVVDSTKKIHDQSVAHANNLREHDEALKVGDEKALQQFRGRSRLTGTHPGASIRHQRDEESSASDGNGAKLAPESPAEEMGNEPENPVPKKRGRKKTPTKEPGDRERPQA